MSDKTNNIGLCYIYEDIFPIGTAINAEMIERYGCIITDNFSSITSENEFFRDTLIYQITEMDVSMYGYENRRKAIPPVKLLDSSYSLFVSAK